MAKRFTETSKWADPWFQDLSPVHKCTWFFILDNCDTAGVWVVNTRLLSFQIGQPITLEEIKTVFRDRLDEFAPGRMWVEKFIDFQYGTLSPAAKPHQKVISLLKGYGLWDAYSERFKGYAKGMDRVQEEEEDKDKEEDQEKEEGGKGETKPPPSLPVTSHEAVAHEAYRRANRGLGQADCDRALAVLKLYPDRASDGRAVIKDTQAQNVLASRIAENRNYAWEEHAELERQNQFPKNAHAWALTVPDGVALAHLRALKTAPTPAKPGERPRKTLNPI